MKKVDIITKNNGKKKGVSIKIKSSKDIAKILAIINYYIVKEEYLPDIDLTGKTTFKVDGEKVSVGELKKILKNQKEIPFSSSSNKKKDKKKDNKSKISSKSKNKSNKKIKSGIEMDNEGRVIIHSRHNNLSALAMSKTIKKKPGKIKLGKKKKGKR